jgi:hypothetical protein
MRGAALVVWLVVGVGVAMPIACSPPLAPPPAQRRNGGQQGAVYFDALPPFTGGHPEGTGGRPAPLDARAPEANGGAGGGGAGGGGAGGVDAREPDPEDAGAGGVGADAKAAAPDVRADVPPLDARAADSRPPDGPPVRPGITTLTLDVSGVSTRGVLAVVGYGGFAFPFNPALTRRALTTVSAATIVNLASTNHMTCHASEADAIKFISSLPVTSLGSATVVELRVDMPLYVPGDTFEHLPTEFCVGFRRGGTWTWQPMPLQALLMRDTGHALLVASIGPQPAGSPGVDALGVLAEGGAVVRTIEIDIRR